MKKKTLLIIILLSFPILVLSQTLNIHKNDGTVFQVGIGDIDSISFTTQSGTPCLGTPTVSYAEKIYNTVQIGDQCWLSENLDVGTMIDSLQNSSDNGIIEKYCYRNNEFYCFFYGGLYLWDESIQYVNTEGTQGICPQEWHIPTYGELQTLVKSVGNSGNALKALGQGKGDGAGTNTSGFNALLAGQRETENSFHLLSVSTSYWSSTEFIPPFGTGVFAHDFELNNSNNDIYWLSPRSDTGISIRCLKD